MMVACGALVLATMLAAQEPQSVFRSRADLVAVRAIVTDSKGRAVPGLTASDFAVFEDDVEREHHLRGRVLPA
jgi:hypothetical protein